jgi:hypothetical protein
MQDKVVCYEERTIQAQSREETNTQWFLNITS